VLLMTKDSVVSAHQVEQVRRFEAQEGEPFAIVVHAAAGAKSAQASTVPQ
jgi:hypothetical protein